MVKKTLVESFVEDPGRMRLFQQEKAVCEAAELIESLMKRQGVSRSDFARRLGKSSAWVSRLLDKGGNGTVRTLADALAVLGHELHFSSRPIQIGSST